MTWVVPSLEFEIFRKLWIFAASGSRVWIASISTDQPVDHKFERTWCLIPIYGTDNHHSVRRRPLRIDFAHPVAHLPHRVIRITGTRPMAKRHRCRNTCLARVDDSSIFRSEPAHIE